eukprot:177889_1
MAVVNDDTVIKQSISGSTTTDEAVAIVEDKPIRSTKNDPIAISDTNNDNMDHDTVYEVVSPPPDMKLDPITVEPRQKREIETEALRIPVDEHITIISSMNELIKKVKKLSERDKLLQSKYDQLKEEYDEYKQTNTKQTKTTEYSAEAYDEDHTEAYAFEKQLRELFDIVKGHLDFMKEHETLVNDLISTSPISLEEAKKEALITEKALLNGILNINGMQLFLTNIIEIENLFDSLYTTEQKKRQKKARKKHAKDIQKYANKKKPMSDVDSFVELLFAGKMEAMQRISTQMNTIERRLVSEYIKLKRRNWRWKIHRKTG